MAQERKPRRNGFKDSHSAWLCLVELSNLLQYSGFLTKGQKNRFRMATEGRSKKHTSKPAAKYYRFLGIVNDISLYYFFLCSIAISQNRLESTGVLVVDGLIDKIKSKRDDTSIVHSNIRSLVAQLATPEVVPRPKDLSHLDLGATNADLRGTREVFGEDMATKIRTVAVGNTWRAAVTMSFPTSWLGKENTVLCLLSLDIRERNVKEIGKLLFKAEVDWKDGVYHVIYDDGRVDVDYDLEYRLKGVLDEDIIAVFGHQAHAAIAECPVRAEEKKKGKHTTSCVSMIFSKDTGTISLAMGLEKGTEISKQLYSKKVA